MVDIPEDTKSRALLNQLTELIDKLKTTDARDKSGGFGVGVNDVTNSGDFKELTALVEENHGVITEDTDILKQDATTNKVANQLQIAKEIINIGQQKIAKVFFDQQRKHNQGAKYSRIRIEGQNAQIIAQNELIIESIPRIIEAVEGGAGTPQVEAGVGTPQGPEPTGLTVEEWKKKDLDPNDPKVREEWKKKGIGFGATKPTKGPNKGKKVWFPREPDQGRPEQARGDDGTYKSGPDNKPDTPLRKAAAKIKKVRANFPKRGPGIPGDPTVFHKPGEQAVDFEDKVYNEQAERWIDPETGRFAKEPGEAIAAIAGDVRAGMGYAGGTLDRGASEASRGAAVLSKNMGANAPAIQKGMEALEKADKEQAAAAQKELTNLAKMMTARALGEKYGDQNVSIEDVRVQSKRVQGVMGSQGEVGAKLVEDLGLRDVDSSLSERGFTTAVKNFAGVDSGAGFGKGLRQAFTAERMFGKDSKIASAWNLGERAIAGTGNVIGGMFGMKKKFDSRTIEDRVADEKAEQQLATEAQQKGFQGATGEKGLDILQRDESEDELEKDQKENAEDLEEGNIETEERRETKKETKEQKREVGVDKKLLTVSEKSLKELQEIRKILKKAGGVGGGGGGGGGGGIPIGTAGKVGIGAGLLAGAKKLGGKFFGGAKNLAVKGGTALKGAGPATQGFAQGTGGGLMKGALRGASRFGGAIAGVGMGVYEGVTGFRDAEARADAGELTAEEEQVAKGEAIGGGAGGAGGAIAGAAAGAAIGSIIPVVGTVIGGLVGGAIGYFAGRWGGKKVGGAIADAIPVSAEQLAESNKLAETTLEKVEERDSELATTIRQEAKEIEAQMLEEAGDEVSDNDKAAIKNAGLVKAIQNHTQEIDMLPVHGASGMSMRKPAHMSKWSDEDWESLSHEDQVAMRADDVGPNAVEGGGHAFTFGGTSSGSEDDRPGQAYPGEFGGKMTSRTIAGSGTFNPEALKKEDPEAYERFQAIQQEQAAYHDEYYNDPKRGGRSDRAYAKEKWEADPEGYARDAAAGEWAKMGETGGIDMETLKRREWIYQDGKKQAPGGDINVQPGVPMDYYREGGTMGSPGRNAFLSQQQNGSADGDGTITRTQKIQGSFSAMELAKNDPEAYKEFQEIKKKYRGDPMASAKAINEWGRMGRTEGWGNIERSEDGKTVHPGLEMDNLQGSLESVPVPTGDAIDNMTNLAAQTTADTPATVIVANQPAPPAPAVPSDDGPTIAMMPPRVRTSDSVMQRFQDKRFTV